jgi:hypothetical protein
MHERFKDIVNERRLKGETSTRRLIEGQLHYFCDLAQALHDDGRSKKRPYITVKRQIALYRAGQAK